MAGTAEALACLRWLIVTGEPLPPDALPAMARVAIRDVPLVNAYGPTECADDVTHHVVTTPPDGRPAYSDRPPDSRG